MDDQQNNQQPVQEPSGPRVIGLPTQPQEQPAEQPPEMVIEPQLPQDTPPEPQPTESQEPVTESTQPEYQYQSGQLANTEGYADPNSEIHPTGDSVNWTASEFVDHQKPNGWYALVVVGSVILAAITYLLTRSVFGVVVIVLLGIIIGVFGALKPRMLDYQLGPEGLQVGDKHFNYLGFRSFAVIEGAQMPNIQLIPQKRFAVALNLYAEAKDIDHIVEVLGEYLPFEHRERDFVDKLSARLHF